MGIWYSPPFVTETDEPSPWTDCTWASGLMLANKASGGRYPATRAEREQLRKASRDLFGGSSLADLARGTQERYGWRSPSDGMPWRQLLDALGAGHGAVVQGLYSELPEHFQRWDRKFAGKGRRSAHAGYAQGHDRAGNWHRDAAGNLTEVFWCDPLGRSPAGTPAAQRYRGEWMPIAALQAFLYGLGTEAAVLAATMPQRSV